MSRGKKSLMSKIIQFWFAAVLFVVSGVNANDVTEEDIKKGSVKMYTQLSHTDNFILIDAQEEVYMPCIIRDPKGCSVDYPSLGFVSRRISKNVVQLKDRGAFWCKTSTMPKSIIWKSDDFHPHFWCDKDGWIESK
tara:strand:- start:520 stop:927 length:408 start_codon:yes stop_codon:yes gene_type:complete